LAITISSCINFFPVGLGGESSRGMGKKIFVGRLPQEASAEDLRQYFGRFGHILDVYVPKVR
jgi:RNA recognition motif-containing protein